MIRQNCFFLFACTICCSCFFSCKKNNDTGAGSGTFSDKMKDSVVLYSRDVYLWYNQIPASFSGRNYSDPGGIMEAIRNYSTEPGFTNPVDRWSFAVTQEEWNNISSGISGGFGLNVFFFSSGDLRVKYVEENSPAGRAGIRRGWQVSKINGKANLTFADSSFIISNIFSSAQTSFTFIKPDGNSIDVQLTSATYTEQPVILDTVYSINSKKIGYLVFNSFLGDTSAINNELQNVFTKFSDQNITDIIVDLRYNGGGYVSLQEKLADYLAPFSADGNLMMKQKYNDKNSQNNSTTNFKKAGSLDLSRIFFIVTRGTASASELLINNLKPYMVEKLIGPTPTHGKPVGFFPIPVGDWYIFPVSFRTTNKNEEGGYFDGLPLDNKIADGLDKDWGDTMETCLASTLKYITTGIFNVQHNRPTINQVEVLQINSALDRYSFKGAIGQKLK